MEFDYKAYLLLKAIFPDTGVKYIVTNVFVGTRKMSEALTRLAVSEIKGSESI